MTRALICASIVLFASAPLLAGPMLVPNGSFETLPNPTGWTSNISDWTVTNGGAGGTRSGVFTNSQGFSYDAFDGVAKAVINNAKDGPTTLATTSTFEITGRALGFRYVYITKNAETTTTNFDPFTVTVTIDGTATTYTVTDASNPDLVDGAIGSVFDSKTRDSGWRGFSIDTSNDLGSDATIAFTIGDSTTGGGISGVFLDNVKQIPEPGTLLLFGTGFFGLTLYGRRKLRKKKA